MPHPPDSFRDFGLLPQGGQPPPQKVRCFLSRARIIAQYLGSSFLCTLGLTLAAVLALTMPFPLNLLGGAAAIAAFGTFVFLATHNDYRWVELDGRTLRAKHLYTGRIIVRSLEEIESLATMVYHLRRTEIVVVEALLGRVRGVEICFRDRRTPLRIMRADPAMTNARELIEAVLLRMAEIREIDVEVVPFAGKPLVRHIHWKGETPAIPSGKTLKVCLCCVMLTALLFGGILGFMGWEENRRHVLGSVPPQAVPLQTLIENGPGANPHVVLTDFRFGGYVVEKKGGSWERVWIALVPTGKPDPLPREHSKGQKEIRAVLMSDTIPDDAALGRFLQERRVSGLCADAPRSNFGDTLGPNLVQANPGFHLSSAWLIDELSEPPSADKVRRIFLGAAACYVLIISLLLIFFKKVFLAGSPPHSVEHQQGAAMRPS